MNKYEIYNLINNPNYIIIRFLSCKNYIDDEHFIFLKNLAIKDERCFNSIYPWNDTNTNNTEDIILFNIKLKQIQGWAKIKYSKINNNKGFYYTAYLDQIVTRSSPKLNRAGTILMYFIKEKILNLSICYYDFMKEKIEKIDIDFFYLYSITPSIPFYKKIDFLVNIDNKEIIGNEKLAEHIFTYIPDKKINYLLSKRTRRNIEGLSILHSFEADIAKLSKKAIQDFNDYKIDETCNNENILNDEDIKKLNNLLADNKLSSNYQLNKKSSRNKKQKI